MNERIGFTARLRKEEPWVGGILHPRYEKIAVAEWNPAVNRHYPPSILYCD